MFRKVCLTVMGVGVVSSLMSVGTFATFTATVTNPGNTFAAGTLFITTSSESSANTSGNTNVTSSVANVNSTGNTATGTDFGNGTACATKAVSACGYILKTSNITSEGLEPGQWASGHITIANSGTLPALMAVNVQRMSSSVGTCPSDVTCVALGGTLNITLHDDYTTGYAGGQCIYGKASTPSTDKVAVLGGCDALTALTAQAANDAYGVPGTSGLGQFAATSTQTQAGTLIYIGGNDNTTANVGTGPSAVKRWAPGETHTFTVTLQFPDQGTTTTTIGSDSVTTSNDNQYQNGSVGFDLVWLAQQ